MRANFGRPLAGIRIVAALDEAVKAAIRRKGVRGGRYEMVPRIR
jgi:hypothetical protein